MTNTPWYSNPVFWGVAILFVVNVLQAVVPYVTGGWLIAIDAILAGFVYLSHVSVTNNAVAQAVASTSKTS